MAERETKLMQLRQNINANQAASTPVRKTQLAYVDTAVKPPRNIAKRQVCINSRCLEKVSFMYNIIYNGYCR